jgi:hypothetical protein
MTILTSGMQCGKSIIIFGVAIYVTILYKKKSKCPFLLAKCNVVGSKILLVLR